MKDKERHGWDNECLNTGGMPVSLRQRKKSVLFCTFFVVVLVCAGGVFWGLRGRTPEEYTLQLRPPSLMLVCYYLEEGDCISTEEVFVTPLSEIQNEADYAPVNPQSRALPEQHCIRLVRPDGKEERLLQYSFLKTAKDSYRVNIAENLVKFTETVAHYGGGEYQPIAYGENWYVAFTKWY